MTTIQEHDVVRLKRDITYAGHHIPAGSIGTIVAVYNSGQAATVEFPNTTIDCCITLNTNDIERNP